MGENKVLDTSHKTQINSEKHRARSTETATVTKPVSSIGYVVRLFHVTVARNRNGLRCLNRLTNVLLIALCPMLLALCIFSCALPRIIVLDDPLSPDEHLNLGVTYEKKGELENALKEYKTASKKLPVAYLYIGNIYFQKEEFDEAESFYKKAISKDPQNADAYNNLAWLYFIKRENLDEAERLTFKAIELNPAKKNIYQDTLEKIKTLKLRDL